MKRRDFMRTAGGATAVAAATAGAAPPALAQENDNGDNGDEEDDGDDDGNGAGAGAEPDFGPYLDDAREFDTTADLRGEEEVTVAVGAGDEGLAYDPAAIWIDPGTTVVFEWTGEGGGHNVALEEGSDEFGFDDIIADPGVHYEYTASEEAAEENDGIILYNCAPHEGQGMKGGIAIGDDVPTIDPAEAAVKDPSEFGTDIHEHWVGVSVILMLSVSLVFTFFTLKYGESPHTSGGN